MNLDEVKLTPHVAAGLRKAVVLPFTFMKADSNCLQKTKLEIAPFDPNQSLDGRMNDCM